MSAARVVGAGGGRSAARLRLAAGLGPGAAPAWGPYVAAEPGPGGVRAGGRVAARGVGVGETAGQGGRRRRGVWEAGDVGPGPKGPRERGERQPRCRAVRGRNGARVPPGAVGAGGVGGWHLSLGGP